MATTSKTKKKGVETPPVQLSIWDILEHPLFEKNLSEEMEVLDYAGKHYTELKEKINLQYQKDVSTLELANDSQLKELFKSYSKPEELTVRYVEVITKKSRLGRYKRELISQLFEGLVKRTAIDIINEKEKGEKKECVESSSPAV